MLSCNTLTQPCVPPPCLSPIICLPAHPRLHISSLTCLIPAQCVLEEVASREAELARLREKAHLLWEGQAAGKGFVHRVSQLSAQYLALSNLTKVILSSCSNDVKVLVPNLCVFNCSTPASAAVGGANECHLTAFTASHSRDRILCPALLFAPALLVVLTMQYSPVARLPHLL